MAIRIDHKNMASVLPSTRLRTVSIAVILVAISGAISAVQPVVLRSVFGPLINESSLSPLSLVVNILYDYGLALMVGILFLYISGRGIAYFDLKPLTRRGVGYAVAGVLIHLVAEIGIGIANALFGLTASESDSLALILSGGTATIAVGFLLIVFIAVPAEELFYRNIIQKLLGEHFPSIVAVVVAAILFALSHVPTYYNPSLILMISPFASNLIGGLVYGSIYARTKSIVPSILAHALYNAIGIGLAVI